MRTYRLEGPLKLRFKTPPWFNGADQIISELRELLEQSRAGNATAEVVNRRNRLISTLEISEAITLTKCPVPGLTIDQLEPRIVAIYGTTLAHVVAAFKATAELLKSLGLNLADWDEFALMVFPRVGASAVAAELIFFNPSDVPEGFLPEHELLMEILERSRAHGV